MDNNDILEDTIIIKNTTQNEQISVKEYQKIMDNIIEKIKEGSLDYILNNLNGNNKTSYIRKNENIIIQIDALENQKKENDNISSIKIDKVCEDALKEIYNIDNNISLILIKCDYYIPGIYIPFIKYDIINPITKEILNIKYCENSNIKMDIPVINIDENNIDKYNPNSDLYTDLCKPYNNENGVDLTLYDRKKEYNKKNYSLCPNKCDFKGYDIETKKAACHCDSQSISSNIDLEEIISKEKLLNNFIDIKSISNFAIIKCFKKIISIEKLKLNIGNYIILSIAILYIILSIIFYVKQYGLYIKKLENIFEKKNKNKNIIVKKNIERMNRKNINNNNIITNIDSNIKNKDNIKNKSIIQKTKKIKIKRNLIKNNNKNNKSNTSFLKKGFQESGDISKTNNNALIDSELNSFSYKEALKNDKRSFCQYYISLIKTKHMLIAIFTNNDYYLNIIKLILFLYSFALSYFINALFFTDDTMHKIYEDGGIFNLAYSLPQIIYSFIISAIINSLIKNLALSEDDIINLKQNKNNKADHDLPKYKRKIKIKLTLFFISCLILLMFFWSYLACFGAIYKNTQIYLIKDTLFSFGLSLLYPFLIYLVPASLRISILRHPEYCFKISKLFQSL